MLDLELSAEIEQRLNALAQRTGSSRAEHVRDAILEHIESLEDVALADDRLSGVRRGEQTVPLSKMIARHRVED